MKRIDLDPNDLNEIKKCENSPVYFYNKYVRKEGQKELTEDDYKNFVKQIEYQRDNPLKLRKAYKDRPLLPSECYAKIIKQLWEYHHKNIRSY